MLKKRVKSESLKNLFKELSEEEAMNMYDQLATACIDKKGKNLFLGLKNMEKMHKTRLEEIYVNVAFGEVW